MSVLSDFLEKFPDFFLRDKSFPRGKTKRAASQLATISGLSSVVLASGSERVHGQRHNDPVDAPRRSLVN